MKPEPPPEIPGTRVLAVSHRGDGRHRVLRVERNGIPFIVKCYGRKTGRIRTLLRHLGSVLLVGKSSVLPRGRRRTERETLALWRREGFDVPAEHPAGPPDEIEGPCLALEWISGGTLAEQFRSGDVSFARKRNLAARIAKVLGERHDRAVALGEPRLLFEHPTLEHVLVSGDRFVHFDLEIVFRRCRSVERLVRRELAGFIHSLVKTGGTDAPDLIRTFVDAYPDRPRLARLLDDLERYRAVPVAGWLGEIQRLAVRSRKRYTKRDAVVRYLDESLRHGGSPSESPTETRSAPE